MMMMMMLMMMLMMMMATMTTMVMVTMAAAMTIAMVVLSLRIVFHRKLRFGVFGVLGYYAILYAIMTFNPSDGFSVEDALNILVQIPIAALAVYLSMDLVALERDLSLIHI